MPDRCLFCDAPAKHFCDAVIALVDGGWHREKGRPPYKVTTMEAMLSVSHTCDAPFCDKHGKLVGWVCGKDSDTIDHCTGCVAANRRHPRGLLPAGAFAAVRRQWHAEYRRQRIMLANRSVETG